MESCEDTDFMYPMKADVYYPIVEQGAYGNVQKTWVFNKTIICNFSKDGTVDEEVKPNVNITLKKVLMGRTKKDIRFSQENNADAITNVVITNIRTRTDVPLYIETSGVRAGKSTIYEIESQSPIIGPFGDPDYYALAIRRSENQASDI
jgi:hypothetical protein